MKQSCFIGVDVGTHSARAGIFDGKGTMLAAQSTDIALWHPQIGFAEQSSDDIWRACCESVRAAMKQSGANADRIGGMGFDATCSLVVLGEGDRPLPAGPTGLSEQNVIVWMDHRSIEQARRINATDHEVLRYVGGVISPEMQSPKLLWLKENIPQTWNAAAKFFDLPDYLTFRATGTECRSLCSTVCKWTYQGHIDPTIPGSTGAWDDSFWNAVGLGELEQECYSRIGRTVRPMGEPVGKGLSVQAAQEFGLLPGTPVGVSIIDAHAGGLGLLGVQAGGDSLSPETLEGRLALICGTSSCHMAVSREPRFIPGVWGPYYSAMIPHLWLTEGGQSATGALIDHIVFSHARALDLKEQSNRTGKSIYALLNERLSRLAQTESFPARLTRQLNVLPYFHGNRSPRANPDLRGTVAGLTLSATLDDLALLYLATVQAIAHGTRHIITAMNEHGYNIDTIFACGGGTKNALFMKEHADITGCRIVLPAQPEAVLLGSAILGAVAGAAYPSILDAMTGMSAAGEIIEPECGEVKRYHDAKHEVFHRMHDHLLSYQVE